MGAGNDIRLASLPADLLVDPVGDVHPGTRSARLWAGRTNVGPLRFAASGATDRQSRSHVTLPRFTAAAPRIARGGADRVHAGRECLLNTALSQPKAPANEQTVAGALLARSAQRVILDWDTDAASR